MQEREPDSVINEESRLEPDPEVERHTVEEFVPDGLFDEANVEDPADAMPAEEAALRVARARKLA